MITSGQTTVGLTSTIVDGTSPNNFRIIIHNLDNTSTVYLGNGNVTPTTGFALDANAVIQFDMNPLEEIHAVSTKTGHVITWLKQV
jgi:hypothetical protein